jgi:para-nitrobenzyl esterase
MRSHKRNIPALDRRAFLRRSGSAAAAAALLSQGFASGLRAQNAPAGISTSPPVDTTAGKIRGLVSQGVNIFKGIAYGASTAGAARFMPPAKPVPWTGVRDAFELGQRAPQGGQDIMFITFPELERPEPEGEECLCLNVWTPAADAGKRPVMVWLHGGGYATGSGGFIAYDGANLARHEDVVAVTVNHRLNVFGFLNVAALGGERYAQSSNLGMQDIVAALQWVHENIGQFGGDPGNVTIYGQSGGGGKVSTLLAMPAAKGLFHRAIIESGSTVREGTRDAAASIAQEYLGLLKLKSVNELQQLPMEQIRAHMFASMAGPFRMPAPGARPAFSVLALGPFVDGQWLPNQLTDPAALALSADIPLLTGCNETELTFFPGAQLEPIDEAALHAQVKTMLHTDDASADRIIAAYRASRPAATPLDIAQALASDRWIRKNLHEQVDLKISERKAPVYVYYFNWRTPVKEGKLKACHCLEIPFVMHNLQAMQPMIGSGAELTAMADAISGAWSAFARTGRPDHASLPHWPAYELARRPTMILNASPKLIDDPERAERAALDSALQLPPA